MMGETKVKKKKIVPGEEIIVHRLKITKLIFGVFIK